MSDDRARQRAIRIRVVLLAALAGAVCCLRKPPHALVTNYAAQWHCEIDAVNAKTGDPEQMRCTDPEGRKFRVRKEE
jgi:hypothetical protein